VGVCWALPPPLPPLLLLGRPPRGSRGGIDPRTSRQSHRMLLPLLLMPLVLLPLMPLLPLPPPPLLLGQTSPESSGCDHTHWASRHRRAEFHNPKPYLRRQ